MNLIDVLILLLVLLALRRGLRLGLLHLTLSACGFLLGLYLGSLIANFLGRGINDAAGRLLAAITLSTITGFILAGAGEAIAKSVGEHLHRFKLGHINNYLGAAAGAIVMLLITWILASSLANASTGNLGKNIRSSAIISTLNSRLPPPPDLLSNLERIIDASGFPRAFIGNEPRRAPVANPTPLNDAVIQSAQKSVVQIIGRGCGGAVEGSGVVVANNVVATNAHVVAGIDLPRVLGSDGRTYSARPIYFDPSVDLALLRAENLPIPPLSVTANTLPDGTSVAVMGFPGGGPLTISSGVILESITALGRDIYDRGLVSRDIYSVHALIESGSSGGPVIDGQGRVIGLVFAKSVSEEQVGYALRGSEFVGAIEQYGSSVSQIDTQGCTAH